jgi:signal transduction histidine kinase
MTADDLLLGDIVGRLVTGALELNTLVQQLRESAAGEERVHLARELHDGVLQSLTAASLQAQRARQSVATSPSEAERRLAMVEETILSEQQALRLAIEDLKPGAMKETAAVDVIPRVRETANRVGRQWDVRVHLNLQRTPMATPQKIAHELTRMLQEALVNAIRHGGAKDITVTCLTMGSDLALAVSYEGRGFAGFQGRHDLASLNRMRVGPRTLKERVQAVNGSLVIESNETGARVEIRLPSQGKHLRRWAHRRRRRRTRRRVDRRARLRRCSSPRHPVQCAPAETPARSFRQERTACRSRNRHYSS